MIGKKLESGHHSPLWISVVSEANRSVVMESFLV